MAEGNGRTDGWWKILHPDDSMMTREELRSPNPGLPRVAHRNSRGNYALEISFLLIDGTKKPGRSILPATDLPSGPKKPRPGAGWNVVST